MLASSIADIRVEPATVAVDGADERQETLLTRAAASRGIREENLGDKLET